MTTLGETLGETLANERRRAGKSLGDVEQSTRIRRGLLEALEKGDYARLPSTAYVRGYIASYAKFLEIPVEPLMHMYEQEMKLRPPQTDYTRIHLPEPEVPTSADVHVIPLRGAVAIAIAVAIVALAVWGIGRQLSGPKQATPLPVPAADASATPAGGSGPGETTSPADATGVGAPADQLVPFKVKVVIASGQASWLRVLVDGLKAYEGTMADGESREWQVKDEAIVRMGRPSAVTVYRDGQKVTDVPKGQIPSFVLKAQPPE